MHVRVNSADATADPEWEHQQPINKWVHKIERREGKTLTRTVASNETIQTNASQLLHEIKKFRSYSIILCLHVYTFAYS